MQLRTEQRSTSRPSSPEVESLEAQVGQLQSRQMYMEEEKARLVAAAKGKNEQVQVVNAATMFVIGNPTCCTGYEDHARWAAWCNAWLLIKLTPKGVLFSSLFFQEHDQCETKHQAHQSHLCCLFVDHKVEDMQLTCLTSVQALICQGV